MDFEPNELQRMLRESASGFVAARRTARRAATADEDWEAMSQRGWLALQLPEALGGADGGPNEIMILMEALGEALTTSPFLSTAVIGARAIVRHAAAPRQQVLLPRLARGDLRLALAHSVSGEFVRDAPPAALAVPAGDGFRLSGEKRYVLDGPSAHAFVVSARLETGAGRETVLFLVDADAPGIERRDFARLDGGGACHLRLHGVQVAAQDRLGGAAALADLLDLATVAVCAEAIGVMQALNDRTLEYLKIRRQFGRRLAEFQALQHRQVDMLIAAEQARSIVMAACMALAEADPAARRLVPTAKVIVGRAGRSVAQGAVQLHGGIGMTAELPIGAYFKRMMVIDGVFGTADQHLRALARVSAASPISSEESVK